MAEPDNPPLPSPQSQQRKHFYKIFIDVQEQLVGV